MYHVSYLSCKPLLIYNSISVIWIYLISNPVLLPRKRLRRLKFCMRLFFLSTRCDVLVWDSPSRHISFIISPPLDWVSCVAAFPLPMWSLWGDVWAACLWVWLCVLSAAVRWSWGGCCNSSSWTSVIPFEYSSERTVMEEKQHDTSLRTCWGSI